MMKNILPKHSVTIPQHFVFNIAKLHMLKHGNVPCTQHIWKSIIKRKKLVGAGDTAQWWSACLVCIHRALGSNHRHTDTQTQLVLYWKRHYYIRASLRKISAEDNSPAHRKKEARKQRIPQASSSRTLTVKRLFHTRATTSNSVLPSRIRCLGSQICKRNAVVPRNLSIHTRQHPPFQKLWLRMAKQSEQKHVSRTWFLCPGSSGAQKYDVLSLEPSSSAPTH